MQAANANVINIVYESKNNNERVITLLEFLLTVEKVSNNITFSIADERIVSTNIRNPENINWKMYRTKVPESLQLSVMKIKTSKGIEGTLAVVVKFGNR